MTRKDGRRSVWLAATCAFLLLLQALPAICGGRARHGTPSRDQRRSRQLALSQRIAEARNKHAAKRYYRSVARQEKTKQTRIPLDRRR
jgi:hypothetical protein